MVFTMMMIITMDRSLGRLGKSNHTRQLLSSYFLGEVRGRPRKAWLQSIFKLPQLEKFASEHVNQGGVGATQQNGVSGSNLINMININKRINSIKIIKIIKTNHHNCAFLSDFIHFLCTYYFKLNS